MNVNRITTLGAGFMLAGLAVLGAMFGYAQPVGAGVPPTATAEFTATCVPGQTCATPTVLLKTHTPTSTPTGAATSTAAPSSTSAPSTTPVPATQTPSGGNQGAGVRPPNTGSGDGAGNSTSMWVIVLGAGLMAAGAGSLVTGMRRR